MFTLTCFATPLSLINITLLIPFITIDDCGTTKPCVVPKSTFATPYIPFLSSRSGLGIRTFIRNCLVTGSAAGLTSLTKASTSLFISLTFTLTALPICIILIVFAGTPISSSIVSSLTRVNNVSPTLIS